MVEHWPAAAAMASPSDAAILLTRAGNHRTSLPAGPAVDNAVIAALNARFRREGLNEGRFLSLVGAQERVNACAGITAGQGRTVLLRT